MGNNLLSGKNFLLLLTAFSLVLLASCANLPGKTEKPASDLLENNSTDTVPSAEASDSDQTEQFDEVNTWSEPAPDRPTVTAIVLGIEKTGLDSSMIFRDPGVMESYEFSDQDAVRPVIFEQASTPVPTAVQNFSQGGLRDEMEIYSFNPVNGAVVLPGQSLHLDVTLRNTGTTTWQTSYKLIDYSGNPMAVTKEYNLPYPVAPGGTVLISIYMAAPSSLGSYAENFRIEDSYGAQFGKFDYILTVGDFSYVTAIPTLTATITPTYYSPDGITATPDSLAWMCIDPERSKLQDCYSFCVEYSDRPEFKYCFYNGERYLTPVP